MSKITAALGGVNVRKAKKLLFPKTNLNFAHGQSFMYLKATMRPFFLVFVLSALTVTLSLKDQPTYVPRASLQDSLVGQPVIKILTIES